MLEIIDSIDKEKGVDFVATHPEGNIFQTPEMAEVYSHTKNYSPFLLALVRDDVVRGVLLSTIIKENSFFGSFSSRAIVQGGPLIAEGVSSADAIRFMELYNRRISGLAMFTQARLLSSSSIESILQQAGYQGEERLNFLIDLNRSIDDVWRSIPKSRRKNIQRAEKMGLEVSEMKKKEQLTGFYDLIKETYCRVKVPVADISLFEAAFDILAPKKMAKFYLAWFQGKPIASRVVLTYNGLVYDWYAGTSNEHMNLYANEALVWRVLQDGVADGFHTFDFGGAGKPGENAGRYIFKKRFGGREIMQNRYIKIYSPIKMKIADIGFSIYRKRHVL